MVFLQGNTSQNTIQTVAKNYHSIPSETIGSLTITTKGVTCQVFSPKNPLERGSAFPTLSQILDKDHEQVIDSQWLIAIDLCFVIGQLPSINA